MTARSRSLVLLASAALLLGGAAARGGALPPRGPTPPGAFPFSEYDALLKRYVDDEGRVDYQGLKARDAAAVERLYASVAATGPDKTPALYPGRGAALAYYLSAYNVLVWKNVIDGLPGLKRVDEGLYRFFREPDFQVDGKVADLDDLEKKIILPRFRDGRVHFALNCASGGCPRLPREAFVPDKVQAQLDREARRFCSERRNVDYDPATRRVRLSMIFKWYRKDFGDSDGALLGFINRHRAPAGQIPLDAKIEHLDYDWRMNDRSLPGR